MNFLYYAHIPFVLAFLLYAILLVFSNWRKP